MADPSRHREFSQETALRTLAKKKYKTGHIAAVLRRFGATRFHNQAAGRLRQVFKTPTVVIGD